MSASDYDINSQVRQVVVRHWIDPQLLRFRTFRGQVRFQGSLQMREGRPLRAALTLADLLEQETRRIAGVRRVFMDLDNWTRDKAGRWNQVKRQTPANP